MNKIKGSNLFKTILWILTTVFLMGFLISLILMVFMSDFEAFSTGYEERRNQEIQRIVDSKIEKAVWDIYTSDKVDNLSSQGLYYKITDKKNKNGDYLYSNLTEDMLADIKSIDVSVSDKTIFNSYNNIWGEEYWLSNVTMTQPEYYYCKGVIYNLDDYLFYYKSDKDNYYVAENIIIKSNDYDILYELKYNADTKMYDQIYGDDYYAENMELWSIILFDEVKSYDISDIKCVNFSYEMQRKIVKANGCYLNRNFTLVVPVESTNYASTVYEVDYFLDPSVIKTTTTISLDKFISHFLYGEQNISAFEYVCNAYNYAYYYRKAVPAMLVASALLSIICLITLFRFAGYRKNSEEIELTFFDKIPFDIFSCIYMLIAGCCIGLVAEFCRGYSNFEMVFIFSIGTIVCILFTIWYLLSLAVRIKKHVTIKNTLIAIILRFIIKSLSKLGRSILSLLTSVALFWKSALIMACLLLFDFIALIVLVDRAPGGFCLIFGLTGLAKLVLCLYLLKIFRDANSIKLSSERIADGHLDEKIDTSKMVSDLKIFGENLNNISNGLTYAVDEKIKSERMKTELITNVSHDIKTPLTSIINYVDLLEKEEIENENAKEYLDVLDRQSKKLKKLIEDLVEASKASTGNLAVSVEKIDATVILSQATGEFQEKLEENGLSLIVNVPEPPVEIVADGRHLWRVIDNIMNNICKYAEQNSRVYVNLEQDDRCVNIIFRNMSKYQLNISGEELMERFVRGDESRNTEGHGLGLSIAKSLMDLMDGNLEVVTDGDLFKVILTCKKY